MRRPRVLLADDHAMFREGLALLLHREVDVVASVSTGRELVEAAHRYKPDVIIADLTMPEMDGLEALRRLTDDGLASRFIMLTVHADAAIAASALRAGAVGYVVKHAAGEELLQAVHSATAGRSYVSPLVSSDVVQRLAHGTPSPGDALTSRQREVLRQLAAGRRVKEIAADLHISVRTVETHKYEIMRVLEIDNTADLVRFAIRQGIVDA